MTDDESMGLTRRTALALGGATLGGLAIGNAGASQHENGEDDEMPDDNGDDANGDGGARRYRVTVTNLTSGQPFTPPAVALHQPSVEVFSVGDPANEPTQEIAENGNLQPLLDLIGSTDAIRAAGVGDAPLVPKDDPGDTGNPYYTTLELSADASATHLTFISMLIATNDGIVGLDTVELPTAVNESKTLYANGYDVGTEENTELYADLVPPAQELILGESETEGTAESDPDLAEDGVIRPHPGISGDGDLDPELFDWREPAAVVQVERLPSDGMADDEAEPAEEETPEDDGMEETPPEPDDGMAEGNATADNESDAPFEDEVGTPADNATSDNATTADNESS